MAELVEGTSLLRKHRGLNLYQGFESLRLRQSSETKTRISGVLWVQRPWGFGAINPTDPLRCIHRDRPPLPHAPDAPKPLRADASERPRVGVIKLNGRCDAGPNTKLCQPLPVNGSRLQTCSAQVIFANTVSSEGQPWDEPMDITFGPRAPVRAGSVTP